MHVTLVLLLGLAPTVADAGAVPDAPEVAPAGWSLASVQVVDRTVLLSSSANAAKSCDDERQVLAFTAFPPDDPEGPDSEEGEEEEEEGSGGSGGTAV